MTSSTGLTRLHGLVAVCVLALVGACCVTLRVAAQSGEAKVGLPHDWSHHHVVFSTPRDVQTLLKIRQDPRFFHQWMRRNGSAAFNRANRMPFSEISNAPQLQESRNDHDDSAAEKGVDWSFSLGSGGSFLPHSKYPASFSVIKTNPAPNDTSSCTTDFVVFPTNRPANVNGTQATIVGFDNLYSTQNGALPAGLCGTNGPSVKWAYQTGSGPGGAFNAGSLVMTSPALSLDGTKVAFVSRTPGTVHVIKIGTTGNNGTILAPVTPGAGNNAIEVRIALNGGRPTSLSSIFVDFDSDTGYVGDNGGFLHKVTGIFLGTPAEVTSGGWPVRVSVSGATLDDPVFDFVSGNVFVTDSTGNLSYVRDVGSTVGSCLVFGNNPPCLGNSIIGVSSGSAVIDGPIVDSSTRRVFTGSAANGGNSEIVQTDTALTPASVVRAIVGPADPTPAALPLHNGWFDDTYINSDTTAGTATPAVSGFYYVCGRMTVGANVLPALYRIGFSSTGVMNAAPDPAGPALQLARGAAQCSPVTEFFNPTAGKQWLFVSVSTRCGTTNAAGIGNGGCIMAFDTTSNAMPASAACNTAGGPTCVTERNGTSGIIVDNTSTATQASSIYFTNDGNGLCGNGIATGGCAVKLTQSGLK